MFYVMFLWKNVVILRWNVFFWYSLLKYKFDGMCNNFKNWFLNFMSDECFLYFYIYRKIWLYNCLEMVRIWVKISYISIIYLIVCVKVFCYLKKVFRKGK